MKLEIWHILPNHRNRVNEPATKQTKQQTHTHTFIVANSHLKVTHYRMYQWEINLRQYARCEPTTTATVTTEKKYSRVTIKRSIEIYVNFGAFCVCVCVRLSLCHTWNYARTLRFFFAKYGKILSHLFRVYDANKSQKQTKRKKSRAARKNMKP